MSLKSKLIVGIFLSVWSLIVESAELFEDKDLIRIQETSPSWLELISIRKTVEKLDGFDVRFTTVSKNSDTYFFFVMHDEENDAFDSMIWAINTFGGIGIAVENDEQRNIPELGDLNGQFAKADRPELNEYFKGYVKNAEIVVALHNNLNSPDGSFDLNANIFTSPSPCKAVDDIDDVIVMSRLDGVQDSPVACTDKMVVTALERGLNVAWAAYQDRTKMKFNCSSRCNFQKYSTSYLGARYFNLEAEHGKGYLKQAKQLCAILDSYNELEECRALQN